MTAVPLLEVRDLSVVLGGGKSVTDQTPVLRRVNLKVNHGEITGVVGESGAGKSMLGRAILDLLPRGANPVRGEIFLKGQNLLTMSRRERRRFLGRSLSLIPQDPLSALNPCRKISSQIGEVLRAAGETSGNLKAEVIRRLDEVRIPSAIKVAKSYPHELSGGMRQRVLIASAFAANPKLVVADEPTTALDVVVQRDILRLMRRMQSERNVGLLFITHDLGVVAKICSQVTVMHGGRVVETAETQRLLTDPESAYARALLAATPRHDKAKQSIKPIPEDLTLSMWQDAEALNV